MTALLPATPRREIPDGYKGALPMAALFLAGEAFLYLVNSCS